MLLNADERHASFSEYLSAAFERSCWVSGQPAAIFASNLDGTEFSPARSNTRLLLGNPEPST